MEVEWSGQGVEPVTLWGAALARERIPAEVKSQLASPDLLLVRPHGARMDFADFLDIVHSPEAHSFSAYLEYSSIKDYMKGLDGKASFAGLCSR